MDFLPKTGIVLTLIGIILYMKAYGGDWINNKGEHSLVTMVNSDGELNPYFLLLLSIMNIKHDGSLSDIVKKTQAVWLRPAGKERWEADELLLDEKVKEKVYEYFNQLGMIKNLIPKEQSYDGIIIFGARAESMEKRYQYAIELINEKHLEGINQIIFLVGQRPLLLEEIMWMRANGAEYDDYDKKNLTETDAARFIYRKIKRREELHHIKVEFIDTPLQRTESNGIRRPNTEDSVKYYMEIQKSQKKGVRQRYLAISNQPYCAYQNEIITKYFKNTETVGPAADEKLQLSLYFDTLGRLLYVANQHVKQW